MSDGLLKYRKFTAVREADELTLLLKDNEIPAFTENISAVFDITFSNRQSHIEYAVRIRKTDFEAADKVLLEHAVHEQTHLPEGHYLLDLTANELLEVLEKPDEWSDIDHLFAVDVLRSKGKDISSAQLITMRKDRIEELRKPEPGKKGWIISGYLFGFLGGLWGMFLAHHYLKLQKDLTQWRAGLLLRSRHTATYSKNGGGEFSWV